MEAPTLTQSQCEALVDILVLTMYTDGHLSLQEDEALKQKIKALPWDPNQSPSIYLSQSIAEAREVEEISQAVKALEEKAAILETPEAKAFALHQATSVLGCDEIIDEEKEFQSALKWALK